MNNPIFLRRVEAFLIFCIGLWVYRESGFSWVTFAVLFFLPDAGAIGYLKSHKLGSTMYNLTHWLIWPISLGAFGVINDHETAKMIAIIWITHICFDRMLGWGFKTGGSFYVTGMGLKKSFGQKGAT